MRRIAARLRELGAEPTILDLSRFPGRGHASIRDGVPVCPGVDLDAIGAWYVRSMPLALPFAPLRDREGATSSDELAADTRRAYAAGRERRSFAHSLVKGIERGGARLVNGPESAAQHFLKLEQLELLRAAGVRVPRTLATNDPHAVAAFGAALDAPLVYKPIAGGGLCRRVTADDLRGSRLRALAAAPVLFQEEVAGRNIRVYVVGGEVVGVFEIVSDELDYRGAETAVRVDEATCAERAACVAAAAACGMTFTGIDLRRGAGGDFAVLECNPSPMFAAVERRTGSSNPVTRALSALLAAA